MAALLTMIAVMSILLTAALPVWRHEMQREKEAELVFRGEQYVHAIGLFQRKFATYPPNVDVLVKQKFLRKKYLDPITGKDFRAVYVGQLQQQPGQPGQPNQPGQRPGGVSMMQPSQSPFAGQRPPAGVGGLMGVVSTSEEDSIRIYKGRTKYNQWQFLYAGATARPGGPGGVMPGVQRPGLPGQGPGGRRPGQPGEGGRMRRPGGPGGMQPQPQPQGMRPPGGN